jgi:hypothetical protein
MRAETTEKIEVWEGQVCIRILVQAQPEHIPEAMRIITRAAEHLVTREREVVWAGIGAKISLLSVDGPLPLPEGSEAMTEHPLVTILREISERWSRISHAAEPGSLLQRACSTRVNDANTLLYQFTQAEKKLREATKA